MMKVTIDKYEFTAPDGDYRIHVKRAGDDWLTFEQGHKAILALMYEVAALREKLAETEKYADETAEQLQVAKEWGEDLFAQLKDSERYGEDLFEELHREREGYR